MFEDHDKLNNADGTDVDLTSSSANENARPLARFFSQNYVADRCRAASTPSPPPPSAPASPRVYNDAHCTDLFFMRHTTRRAPLSRTIGAPMNGSCECLTKSDPRVRGRRKGVQSVPPPRRKGDVITSGPQFCAAADIRTR